MLLFIVKYIKFNLRKILNYLEIVQLAFSQNFVKTIIYSLPAIFLCLLALGNMINSCTSSFRNEAPTDMFDILAKAGNGLGLFVMAFIIFLLGIFCSPKFDWVELKSSNSKKFVEEIYADNIKKINTQDNPVYSLLENQEREMRNFKKIMEKQNPGKNFMFSNSVENIVKNNKNELLQCIKEKKNTYLTKIQSDSVEIKDIKEDTNKFGAQCSVIVAENIMKAQK